MLLHFPKSANLSDQTASRVAAPPQALLRQRPYVISLRLTAPASCTTSRVRVAMRLVKEPRAEMVGNFD